MPRAPFQVLIIPFRAVGDEREFCLFFRRVEQFWHFICGGGEDDESILDAAHREADEEAGFGPDMDWYRLDTVAPIPVAHFEERRDWPDDTLVIPEYYFAIDAADHDIALSDEHTEFCWVNYATAMKMLYWDVNKTGLWELYQRLQRDNLVRVD